MGFCDDSRRSGGEINSRTQLVTGCLTTRGSVFRLHVGDVAYACAYVITLWRRSIAKIAREDRSASKKAPRAVQASYCVGNGVGRLGSDLLIN